MKVYTPYLPAFLFPFPQTWALAYLISPPMCWGDFFVNLDIPALVQAMASLDNGRSRCNQPCGIESRSVCAKGGGTKSKLLSFEVALVFLKSGLHSIRGVRWNETDLLFMGRYVLCC